MRRPSRVRRPQWRKYQSSTAVLGYLLVFASALSFGFLPLFLTDGLRAGMTKPTMLFWRYVLATAVFLPYAIWHDRWKPTRHGIVGLLVVGLVLSPLQALLYLTAVQYAGPALATLLLHLYPVFVCIGAVALHRQRWNWWIPGILALALLGIQMTLGPIEQVPQFGVVIGFATGIEYAIYVLGVDLVAPHVPSRTLAGVTFCGTAMAFGVVGTIAGEIALPPNAQAWRSVLLLALVCTIAAVWLLYESMTYIGPARASLASMTEAVWALIVSVLFLEVRMNLLQWLGAALVIASALVGAWLTSKPPSSLRRRRGATRDETPPPPPVK